MVQNGEEHRNDGLNGLKDKGNESEEVAENGEEHREDDIAKDVEEVLERDKEYRKDGRGESGATRIGSTTGKRARDKGRKEDRALDRARSAESTQTEAGRAGESQPIHAADAPALETPAKRQKTGRLVQRQLAPEPTPLERLWRTPSASATAAAASSGASPTATAAGPSAGSAALTGQLYLNLGQKHFAHYTCPNCQMVFVRGRPEDDELHRRHHRAVLQGIHIDHVPPAVCLATEVDDSAVLLVTADSPKAVLRKVRPAAYNAGAAIRAPWLDARLNHAAEPTAGARALGHGQPVLWRATARAQPARWPQGPCRREECATAGRPVVERHRARRRP